jgi:hypothetical protein
MMGLSEHSPPVLTPSFNNRAVHECQSIEFCESFCCLMLDLCRRCWKGRANDPLLAKASALFEEFEGFRTPKNPKKCPYSSKELESRASFGFEVSNFTSAQGVKRTTADTIYSKQLHTFKT